MTNFAVHQFVLVLMMGKLTGPRVPPGSLISAAPLFSTGAPLKASEAAASISIADTSSRHTRIVINDLRFNSASLTFTIEGSLQLTPDEPVDDQPDSRASAFPVSRQVSCCRRQEIPTGQRGEMLLPSPSS